MFASPLIPEMREESSQPSIAAVSQNERAYSLLKDRVTTLAYKPGEYLNTASLMTDLGLGRTPLNHALHRLATEGLVQVIPRKGVMVAPLSIDDALHMIDVRLVNEGLCARLASQRITPAEIQTLRDIAESFDKAVDSRDVPRMMQFDGQFHEQIALASRNPVLIEVLRVLHARSQRFWAISLSTSGHVPRVRDEHHNIIDALQNGDADTAEQTVLHHILSFRQALLSER